MSKRATLLWLDLEMTGLSPVEDRIIEVAAIATDWEFNELGQYESGVKQSANLIKTRMTGDFWEKNAKTRDALVAASKSGKTPAEVEAELLAFIKQHFGKVIYLAGNSIHQDRKFIEKYWPNLDKVLHYRMLDVSAWKIYFENAKKMYITKPENHRALNDIRGSIEELKCYLKKVS
ncbi:MAG: oligoribonuclease [Candidatus Saccharimonadales bacterium]